MLPVFSLNGKVVLITGASSGIGRAVAQQCAAAGATCIISARNSERLEETLKSLSGEGHSMIITDLTKSIEIYNLVKMLPKIDGVVSCAGIVDTKLLKFTENEDIERIFATNVFSSIKLIRDLIQQKKFNKESSIVLISSISGVKCGYLGGSIYGASKGAIEGFIKGAALELSPQKIRLNSIVPGMVNTHLLDNSNIDSDQMELDSSKYPMKRYGEPEEIGMASVYLLSDSTKWMTGTSLLIDGGYTLN